MATVDNGPGGTPPGKPLRLVRAHEPLWDDEVPPPGPDERPEVVMGADVHRICEELSTHLAARDPGLYQRAHELVTVVDSGDGDLLARGTPMVRSLSVSALVPRVSRAVNLVRCKPKKTRDGEPPRVERQSCQPPPALMSSLRDSPDLWAPIRQLRGMTETPLLRPDGSVRQEAGYDDATGYLYLPACSYPAVPIEPTQADAQRALGALLEVFADFPYVSEESRYVPISAILSIVGRAAIAGPVPAHLFDASVIGSGKTLQCDAAHLIAVGRIPAHATWPTNVEEQEKLLNTLALASPSGCVIDNVKGTFGGSAVEQALTSTSVQFRMLGSLESRSLPWRSVMMVSGNNVALTDDMIRRTLMARLEPADDNPTGRTDFAHPELLEWVAKERQRLAIAALTVLRAYAAKQWPDTGVRLASYSPWARVVAGAIVFAGGADVTRAQPPRERASLDGAGAIVAILDHLPRISAEPITVGAILSAVYPRPARDEPPDGYDVLREALETLCAPKGNSPPGTLGVSRAMAKFDGRWFGPKRLRGAVDAHTKVMTWRVETH